MKKAVLTFWLVALFCGSYAQTYTFTDDDVVVINGIIESCSYDFSLTDVIIPQTLDGQTVTGIADKDFSTGIFYNKGITSVEFPTTLITIGDYAFRNNAITHLDLTTLPVLQTIGVGAFRYNQISTLEVAGLANLETIGDDAFNSNTMATVDLTNCTGLTTIGASAFYNISELTSLNLTGCTALTEISADAFNNANLVTLNFDDCSALETIGTRAFYSNVLTSVDLSGCTALLVIEANAFAVNGSLAGIDLPTNTVYAAYGWKDDADNTYANGETVSDFGTSYSVAIPYALTDDDVVVVNGIIESCSYDFSNTDIMIPQTLDGQMVTGIANKTSSTGVFYNKGITSIILPATLVNIGNYAFSNNAITALNLTTLPLLNSIGTGAFRYNQISSLTVIGQASLASIGDEAFSSNSMATVDFTNCIALTTIGAGAFYNVSELTSLNLAGCTGLTEIGANAFDNANLVTLNFDDCSALVSIGTSAFYSNALTGIDLSGCTALMTIEANAFAANGSLAGFDLPTHAVYAEFGWKDESGNAYANGETVSDFGTSYRIAIPYTLTDADVVVTDGIIVSCSYDFSNSEIIIPQTLDGQTVTGIADKTSSTGVFYNKGITSVELPSTLVTMGNYAFSNNSITTLDLTAFPSLKSVGTGAFIYNNISALTIAGLANLESIGSSAFYSNSLSSVDLSGCNALLNIEASAFDANGSLAGFALPDPAPTGYFYNNWKDVDDVTHEGGSTVSNLITSYTRIMPMVDNLFPYYAGVSGGTEIIMYGENFEADRNNKVIKLNGVEVESYVSWSDTEVTFICPPNPDGYHDLTIELENGMTYLSPIQFIYHQEFPTMAGDVDDVQFSAYPNPTTGKLVLSNLSVENTNLVTVFNLVGEKLYECCSNGSTVTLDFSNYEVGAYLVKVNNQSIKIFKE